jgi:flagellar assembly protein FliH
MNNTSRVLRGEELNAVSQVWWRDAEASAVVPQARAGANVPGTAKAKESLEREAYQHGFSEGQAVGKEQAAAEMKPVLDRMGQTLAELSTMRSRLRREAEKDLLKLAIAIARRVLHRELTIDPESIEGVIRVAIDKLQSRDLSRVRVHPGQAPAIRASYEKFSNSHQVELVADPSLQIGDVMFETSTGTLDASIESQLQEIDRGFADRLDK